MMYLEEIPPSVWLPLVAEAIVGERGRKKESLQAETLLKLKEKFPTEEILRLAKEELFTGGE